MQQSTNAPSSPARRRAVRRVVGSVVVMAGIAIGITQATAATTGSRTSSSPVTTTTKVTVVSTSAGGTVKTGGGVVTNAATAGIRW